MALHLVFTLFKNFKIHGISLLGIDAGGLPNCIDCSPTLTSWLLCMIGCKCIIRLLSPYADFATEQGGAFLPFNPFTLPFRTTLT